MRAVIVTKVRIIEACREGKEAGHVITIGISIIEADLGPGMTVGQREAADHGRGRVIEEEGMHPDLGAAALIQGR